MSVAPPELQEETHATFLPAFHGNSGVRLAVYEFYLLTNLLTSPSKLRTLHGSAKLRLCSTILWLD